MTARNKAPKFRSTVRFIPASQTRPVTATWPQFKTVIGLGECCPDCGHVIKEPRAGAIMLLDGDFYPDLTSQLFKRREEEAKAAAMDAWQKTPAGKAWARLKAKPSKEAYRAAKAAGGAK